jgi:hypothetical protein
LASSIELEGTLLSTWRGRSLGPTGVADVRVAIDCHQQQRAGAAWGHRVRLDPLEVVIKDHRGGIAGATCRGAHMVKLAGTRVPACAPIPTRRPGNDAAAPSTRTIGRANSSRVQRTAGLPRERTVGLLAGEQFVSLSADNRSPGMAQSMGVSLGSSVDVR